ncbi:DUF3141 domain-containing protein [Alsobacter sp. SYSU M60028]|uniref:DUF3141 domain-containing protein n=1 Tax=Alsobacter ponti TaxID=2962936 RepID=A0ABT1L8U2_9HYPH|nr:DUF3141 domain-containing protein [Alsobacter ponti]MCP8937915.1 DUF3141 domain-containing protein [Alsobacter ponti]
MPTPTTPAELGPRLARIFHERLQEAFAAYMRSSQEAAARLLEGVSARALDPTTAWKDAASYWVDFGQRAALFWDTLRQRGDDWLEHEKAGKPPLLHFAYETVADARSFARPVNYCLLRILPKDVAVADLTKRPFVIIDPRAGHGPGIGGFKQDSEVGVALKAGHPVYFVSFFPDPEPGQTLADVSRAEAEFLRIVHARHPRAGRPVLIGNCQGGWAAMLIGALEPDVVGPIVIAGAPMSYWAGNDDENPMRYSGGVLGGVWPALLASDLGGGIFDGAYLVENFENANPANTLVDKPYTLWSKVDSEPPRFLEFERWWGGYFLMNRNEIKWIVENLFVGNRLAKGDAEWSEGRAFDLREIRSPIIVFASLGDNITPPQQAINWVADLYPTTEALKANGQVIVGLMHHSVGHLGIFVSGGVARKEHAQIVEVLQQIEALPPGLYAMQIEETRDAGGAPSFDVHLTERRVEDLRAMQKYDRVDEIPFGSVDRVSRMNEAFYESVVHPWLKAAVIPQAAAMARAFHPLRLQRWALSSLNPAMGPVKGAAELARVNRAPRDDTGPAALGEAWAASMASQGLELARAMRDAMAEYLFFSIYGHMSLYGDAATEAEETDEARGEVAGAQRVREAIRNAAKGDFHDAIVRMALMAVKAGTGRRRLSAMRASHGLLGRGLGITGVNPDELRRRVGQQSAIVEFAPEVALDTLGQLMPDAGDRARALAVFEAIAAQADLNEAQRVLLDELRVRLGPAAPAGDSGKIVALAAGARRKAGRRARA